MAQIETRRKTGEKGRLKIKITREMLMTWTEDFIKDFNYKERSGQTNIIAPCLSRVGQNCFAPDNEAFVAWLDSLSTNALYKAMLDAHTATKL